MASVLQRCSSSRFTRPLRVCIAVAAVSHPARFASTSSQQPGISPWSKIIPTPKAAPAARRPQELDEEIARRVKRQQEDVDNELGPHERRLTFHRAGDQRQRKQHGSTDYRWLALKPLFSTAAYESSAGVQQQWESKAFPQRTAALPATPYTGRSVEVERGDVARAWAKLSAICARNRVRNWQYQGRFFIRPTKQRSQLRSIRHRKRFAELVKKKVQIVQAITRRGG